MSKYYSPTPAEIRALRARLNYTQEQMAEFLMCSTNAYCKWEQGATKMFPVVWNAVQIVVAQAEQQEKPRKLTVYEQRRLEQQAQKEEETKIMKQVLDGWGDEPKQESQEDLAERYKLNQLRIEKEMMITMIEEKAPRLGVDARAQFPDFDNITIPLLKRDIEKLTPVYNSVKDY